MMKIYKWWLGATALALVLAACDDSGTIKFPGFSTPDEETTAPPQPPADDGNTPVGQPDPEIPAGSLPDATETPPAGTDPADTDSPDSNATDTPDTATDDLDAPVDETAADVPDTGDTASEADPVTDDPASPPEEIPAEADPAPTDTATDVSNPSEEDEHHPHPDPTPETPEPAPETPDPAISTFTYNAPGGLLAGSGNGALDEIIYAPDMTFPIKDAPAYPQSMVWGFGGGIGGGDECDARNYRYPWRDNFCEKRTSNYNTDFCPSPKVHLGQDIRVGTPQGCEQMRRDRRSSSANVTLYKVVAVEDGVISNIGSYTVNVRAGSRIYRYLHMNMRALQVSLGDTVTAGDTLGYISKDFGGSSTTFHLHFEIKQNTAEYGWAYVPPYTSLVKAYEAREGGPGTRIEAGDVAVAAAPLPIPEGFIITE